METPTDSEKVNIISTIISANSRFFKASHTVICHFIVELAPATWSYRELEEMKMPIEPIMIDNF